MGKLYQADSNKREGAKQDDWLSAVSEALTNYQGPLRYLVDRLQAYDNIPRKQKAFENLRLAMKSEPVLACPQDDLVFHIWPDASPWAVGGILTQDNGEGHRPIAYEYHKLSNAEKNYPHHEKEILALLHCLRKWRYYFE
jgi:hypothetical protein